MNATTPPTASTSTTAMLVDPRTAPIMRVAGVVYRYPKSVRYVDSI